MCQAASPGRCARNTWPAQDEGSEFRQHAGQDFEPEIFLVVQAVGAAPDDAYFCVEPLDEPQRDLVLRLAVSGGAPGCCARREWIIMLGRWHSIDLGNRKNAQHLATPTTRVAKMTHAKTR
jgi:hypothetical protein